MKSSARCGEPACRNGNELHAAMTRLLARASWVWSCGVRWGPWRVECLLPWSPRGVTAPCCGTGLWHTCAACSPRADVPCLLPFLVRGLPQLPKCSVATARWPRARWGRASGSWKATERGQGGAGRWQRWDARGWSAAGVLWWSRGGPAAGLVDAQPQPQRWGNARSHWGREHGRIAGGLVTSRSPPAGVCMPWGISGSLL